MRKDGTGVPFGKEPQFQGGIDPGVKMDEGQALGLGLGLRCDSGRRLRVEMRPVVATLAALVELPRFRG
jgi:hypothetical protein